jgi:hypothetical protein
MFLHTSRYYSTAETVHIAADGSEHRYIRRRFLPNPAKMDVLSEFEVTEGDRLDNITAKTLGDPEQFWRVCDMNYAMNPAELTSEIGRRLIVPLPSFEG